MSTFSRVFNILISLVAVVWALLIFCDLATIDLQTVGGFVLLTYANCILIMTKIQEEDDR